MSRVKGADGNWYIPATQRPNGTWRRAQKVREGYIPPEERVRYKVKNHVEDGRIYPVGLDSILIEEHRKKFPTLQEPAERKTTTSLAHLLQMQLDLKEDTKHDSGDARKFSTALKNAKKKLREAKKLQKALEQNPDLVLHKEQLEKVHNIPFFTMKVDELTAERERAKEQS
ncbi:Partner of Y14 and mago [Trichuris trichiura]|uniref:Partner of Y14 and mago n=1 Tax=Trichuris trichiura TaxID=36087 RepID=A0A077ZBI8_TRITR|nr:Partner of Y14 and mago [Trichuris trichiura]